MREPIKCFVLVLLSISTFFAREGYAQDFYSLNKVQKIEITFPFNNWDFQLDTAKLGSGNYLMGTVALNGIVFDSVGVKYKGNSSYDSTYEKNPLHIELNTYKNQQFQGYKDIKLSNGYGDPSMIREVLSYSILSNYMKCPKANFAMVYVNGKYVGLYTNAESISGDFCARNFYSETGTFIKGNPMITPGPAVKSNLKYLGEDTLSYMDYYEMLSEGGWKDLKKLCLALSTSNDALDSILDVDKFLWMLAFNNALVNLDSYTGVFAQNYYLYQNHRGVFEPIVWDLNMCFGGFPYAGSPNNGMGSLSVSNMQQFPVLYHATHADWPLISSVLSNATYKRKYLAHVKTLVTDFLSNGKYKLMADTLQTLIDPYLVSDSGMFFTYAQFKGSLQNNYINGSYSVPGLANLCDTRATYLLATAELSVTAPQITNLGASNNKPKSEEDISITATITGASDVWLMYKFNRQDAYSSVKMLDDGLHQDGSANDGIYGANIRMEGVWAAYYLYAENANAGTFLPSNASHNYFIIGDSQTILNKGSLIINEFVCDNNKDDINEYGLYTDWIELYNKGNTELNLFGTYLTDKTGIPNLYEFPAGTLIKPGDYLVVWADKLPNSSKYLHANFNLSADNGGLYLVNKQGDYLDSVVYGSQQSNISLGRCPNAIGSFTQIPKTTFKESNNFFCVTATAKLNGDNRHWSIYPNPSSEKIFINFNQVNAKSVEVYNLAGELKLAYPINSSMVEINTEGLASGIYLVRVMGEDFYDSKKMIILNNYE